MKVKFVIQIVTAAVLALTAFSSCMLSDEAILPAGGDRIVVGVEDEVATKGTVITDRSLLKGQKFGLYAYHKPAATSAVTYLNTQGVVNNDYSATLSQTKYWPIKQDGSLKFYAWYPYEGSYKPTADFTTADRMKLTYSTAESAANHRDMMVAVSEPAWGASVPLKFFHALTKVSFSFRKQVGWPDVIINRITLRNVAKDGTLTVINLPSPADSPKFTWGSVTRGEMYLEAAMTVNSTDYMDAPDTFIVLPSDTFQQTAAIVVDTNEGEYELPMKDIIAENPHIWKSGEHVNYRITFSKRLEIEAEPLPWIADGADWVMGKNRILNVSDSQISITGMNGARISFASNMPEVWVADKGLLDGTTRATNTVLSDITKSTEHTGPEEPSRFHYEYDPVTKTGKGYMDILAVAKDLGSIRTYTYVVDLCAGLTRDESAALKKQLTVEIDNTYLNSPSYVFEPVGAFFRYDQKGERIISSVWNRFSTTNKDGIPYLQGDFVANVKWTATPVYPAGTTTANRFIRLSLTPSFDPMVGTDYAGDAEDYLVADGIDGPVSSRGRVYFRIGASGTVTGSGRVPRYGAVRIDFYDDAGTTVLNSSYVYVRQGEDADYVMRPTDPLFTNTGASTSDLRPLAKPVSPFNLTAKQYRQGDNSSTWHLITPSQITAGEVNNYFTEYPTQAGAFFGWMYVATPTHPDSPGTTAYMRRAYHPTMDIPSTEWYQWGIRAADVDKYWSMGNNKANNETCPPGYHRPNDGVTNADLGWTNTYEKNKNSELRQSLFLNMPLNFKYYASYKTDQTSQPANMKTGVYADGFFDRMNRNDGWESAMVSTTNAQAAYSGTIVFNPYTYASVFFPAAGRREHETDKVPGTLNHRGSVGNYWTTSMKLEGSTYRGSMFNTAWPSWNHYYGYMNHDNTNLGASIRCFKD